MADVIGRSADGSFEVKVSIDWRAAHAHGLLFFDAFERSLEKNFRHVMVLALKFAKAAAPKGDRNFAIEDLDEITRAGGSRNSRPANPRGFAITTDQRRLAATGHGGYRIRKVPGGTLRRLLSMIVIKSSVELLEGRIGVPAGSPAEKYARIAELGGTIAAKKAKYLRYSPDGHTIVFKPVVHRSPHPYLLPTLLYVWPLVNEWLPQTAWAEATAEFGL